jgi:outer membrane protein assembly factor BamA
LLIGAATAISLPANATPINGAGVAAVPTAPAKPASGAAAHTSAAPDDDKDKGSLPSKPGEQYRLLGFGLSGSKHIDADALIAALPQHKGDLISDAQISADTDTIKKALTARHVHFAEVTTAILRREGPGHLIWVIWDIQHIDAFTQAPFQGFWKFGGQTFSGNKALTNEQLEKAIGLKPGERVREGAISDARTGMEQAYDKVFPGKAVKIAVTLNLKVKPSRVATFTWKITEPPAR